MKDLLGKALRDYFNRNYSEDIITSTNISYEEVLPLPYLFRSYEAMNAMEQMALSLAKGNTLDVGCGAGIHSLYLQEKGIKVKAIDISEGAIDVAKQKGVHLTEQLHLLDENGTYDTIIILMNGTGIFQTLDQVPQYLMHLKALLNPDGQILIDSSDIKYMYEDDDGGYWIDLNGPYYGELDYFMAYKGETEDKMKWLYLDFDLLSEKCEQVGLQCELVCEGDHYDYLARITHP